MEKGIINGKVIQDKTIPVDKIDLKDYIPDLDDPKALMTVEAVIILVNNILRSR